MEHFQWAENCAWKITVQIFSRLHTFLLTQISEYAQVGFKWHEWICVWHKLLASCPFVENSWKCSILAIWKHLHFGANYKYCKYQMVRIIHISIIFNLWTWRLQKPWKKDQCRPGRWLNSFRPSFPCCPWLWQFNHYYFMTGFLYALGRKQRTKV